MTPASANASPFLLYKTKNELQLFPTPHHTTLHVLFLLKISKKLSRPARAGTCTIIIKKKFNKKMSMDL